MSVRRQQSLRWCYASCDSWTCCGWKVVYSCVRLCLFPAGAVFAELFVWQRLVCVRACLTNNSFTTMIQHPENYVCPSVCQLVSQYVSLFVCLSACPLLSLCVYIWVPASVCTYWHAFCIESHPGSLTCTSVIIQLSRTHVYTHIHIYLFVLLYTMDTF